MTISIPLDATTEGKLRADGHKVEYFLSICQPDTLLTAQVNGSPGRGATSISVDNGSGTTASIKEGMLLKTVTDYGDEYIRVVSVSLSGSSPNINGTIVVDPNSIPWGDNDDVFIYDDYVPTIIQPTFDPLTGIATKRGQTYSDQNTKPPPVAEAGPWHGAAGFLSGGSLVFSLSGAGTPMAEGAAIASYLWETAIGVVASPSSQNTTLTCNSAGQGWLSLTVTDNQSPAKTHRTNRRIWVHSSDPTSSDYPYVNFIMSAVQLSGLSARMTITVNGVADFDTFRDGALCVVWKREWFGDTEEHISLIEGGENIHFQGYILKDSISKDFQHGQVTFELGSIFDVARQLPLQALYLQAVSSPAFWFQYGPKMTLDRMLHWLVYWHSNLLEIGQFEFSGDTRYKKLYKWNETGLVNQVADLSAKFRCKAGVSKAGCVYIEKYPQLLDAAGRAAWPVVNDITEADYREAIQLRRRHRKEVSAFNLTGFNYDGVNVDTIIPYQALAPTKIRHNTGTNKQSVDGMVLDSQNDANLLAGRYLAIANNEIDEVVVRFAGNYAGVLDMFPQRWWTLTLASGDTPRGVELSSARLLPTSISIQSDQANGAQWVDVTFEVEAIGPDGITIPYPGAPECVPATGGNTELPAATEQVNDEAFPPLALTIFSSAHYAKLSDIIAGQDWQELDTTTVHHGTVDKWWHKKAGNYDPANIITWLAAAGHIYKKVGLTAAKVDLTPASGPADDWGDGAPSPGDIDWIQIESDPFLEDRLYVLARYQNAGRWRGWLAYTISDWSTTTYLKLYDGSPPGTSEVKPLWMAITGRYILVTTWEDDTVDQRLRLLVFDRDTPAFDSKYHLGDCTEAELDAFDKFAFPVATVEYDLNEPSAVAPWHIAGRIDSPTLTGLSASVYHVVKNIDGTWVSVEDSWGTDYCAGLKVGPLINESEREYAAARLP